MFEAYKDVVTVDELCEMLNIGRNLAYSLLTDRKVKSVRIGRVHRIPKANVIKYMKEAENN